MTGFTLNFSHPNEHKFRHNFLDTINPMCSCGSVPETTVHFLLRCQNNVINRSKLRKNVYNLDQTLRNYDDDHLTHILPYGSEKFNFDLYKKLISWPSVIWKILNLPIRVSFEMSVLFLLLLLLLLLSFLFNCIATLIFNIYLLQFFLTAQHLKLLDKNYNIFQTTRFNHTMIFFKLID